MNNNPPNPTVTEEMIEAGLQALTFSKNDREQVAAIYLAMKSAAPQEMCDYCATATPGTFNSDMCECNTDLTDVEQEARFLCERLRDLEGNIFDDEVGTEYYGHVAPSRTRLEMLLADRAALLVSNRSGVEDLKHDLDRYMKIANIECNESERLREALKPFADCVDQIADDEDDEEWAKFRLLVKDYRRAKAALNPPTIPEDDEQ